MGPSAAVGNVWSDCQESGGIPAARNDLKNSAGSSIAPLDRASDLQGRDRREDLQFRPDRLADGGAFPGTQRGTHAQLIEFIGIPAAPVRANPVRFTKVSPASFAQD